jgi:hypothetical protein
MGWGTIVNHVPRSLHRGIVFSSFVLFYFLNFYNNFFINFIFNSKMIEKLFLYFFLYISIRLVCFASLTK